MDKVHAMSHTHEPVREPLAVPTSWDPEHRHDYETDTVLPPISGPPSILEVLATWGLAALAQAETGMTTSVVFHMLNGLRVQPVVQNASPHLSVTSVHRSAQRCAPHGRTPWLWATTSEHPAPRGRPRSASTPTPPTTSPSAQDSAALTGEQTPEPVSVASWGRPLWGRVAAPSGEKAHLNDEERRRLIRAGLARDAQRGQWLDLALMAALGRPALGRGSTSSAWDMVPRNTGANIIATRMRPLQQWICTEGGTARPGGDLSRAGRELIGAGLTHPGQVDQDARVGTLGWQPGDGPVHAVRAWCAIWGMSLFPVIAIDGHGLTLGHLGRMYDREWLVAPIPVAPRTLTEARDLMWDRRVLAAGTVGMSHADRDIALGAHHVRGLTGAAVSEWEAQDALENLAAQGWALVRWPVRSSTSGAFPRWSMLGEVLAAGSTGELLRRAATEHPQHAAAAAAHDSAHDTSHDTAGDTLSAAEADA